MGTSLVEISRRLGQAATLGSRLDLALEAAQGYGLTCILYDFSPVPLSHTGAIITPTLLKLNNVPASMIELWCNNGYYQRDPVQHLAVRSAAPFVWSYLGRRDQVLTQMIGPTHEPVVRYIHDTRMTCGVTVPIHLPDGSLATFTGIRIDPEEDFEDDVAHHLGEIGFLGHAFHAAVSSSFDGRVLTCPVVHLTPRERECLRLCAEGLTAKQIAHRLDRSVATVTLHLNKAARRLKARNRAQTIALAAHYRLLEPVT